MFWFLNRNDSFPERESSCCTLNGDGQEPEHNQSCTREENMGAMQPWGHSPGAGAWSGKDHSEGLLPQANVKRAGPKVSLRALCIQFPPNCWKEIHFGLQQRGWKDAFGFSTLAVYAENFAFFSVTPGFVCLLNWIEILPFSLQQGSRGGPPNK